MALTDRSQVTRAACMMREQGKTRTLVLAQHALRIILLAARREDADDTDDA